MRVSLLIFVAVTAVFSVLPLPRAHAAGAGAAEMLIVLFNGNDLSAFYTYIKDRGKDSDPKQVFSVKDRGAGPSPARNGAA